MIDISHDYSTDNIAECDYSSVDLNSITIIAIIF
jgi:hypothetical protein